MIPQEHINEFTKKIMSQLGFDDDCNNKKEKKCDNSSIRKRLVSLTPAEIMVISGIITDVLSVQSLLVDRDQQVQIVLGGSLKRKTELEKTLDDIGQKPFDEVLKALLGRV